MVLSTITWLADKLMERGLHKDEKLREQWDRVADYFDQIAGTLENMVQSFKKGEAPTLDGNKLNVMIGNFDEIIRSIYSPNDDKEREKSFELLAELYSSVMISIV